MYVSTDLTSWTHVLHWLSTRGRYFVQQIQAPQTWEELRTVLYGKHLKPLVTYLVDDTHHPAVVNALLCAPLPWQRSLRIDLHMTEPSSGISRQSQLMMTEELVEPEDSPVSLLRGAS